jgi:hypothetical protein
MNKTFALQTIKLRAMHAFLEQEITERTESGFSLR